MGLDTMDSVEFLLTAKHSIINNRTCDPKEEVELVWYNYTLGNIKALFIVKLADGTVDDTYYEVTYRKETMDIWIDAYKKVNTVKIY